MLADLSYRRLACLGAQVSTFDQIDNPTAWGYSSGDAEWYNRKQVLTVYDRPVPGYPPGGCTIANTCRHFGATVVAQVCFFHLITVDEGYVSFLADGRRFTSGSNGPCDAILIDMGLSVEHGNCLPNAGICLLGDKANCKSDHNRCQQGVVFQGTPLGAFAEPVLA